jgi:hypothetical protein
MTRWPTRRYSVDDDVVAEAAATADEEWPLPEVPGLGQDDGLGPPAPLEPDPIVAEVAVEATAVDIEPAVEVIDHLPPRKVKRRRRRRRRRGDREVSRTGSPEVVRSGPPEAIPPLPAHLQAQLDQAARGFPPAMPNWPGARDGWGPLS